LFVPLAEEGWIDRPATVEIAREYLLPLKEKGIDVLILGCTHYPVLKDTIRLVMGEGITLLDSGLSCVERVRTAVESSGGGAADGVVRYYVSDMPERFREVGGIFMGRPIDEVTIVKASDIKTGRE
jgi:glutamate racemase